MTVSYEDNGVKDYDKWVADVLIRTAVVTFIVRNFLSLLRHNYWACVGIAGISIVVYGFSLIVQKK